MRDPAAATLTRPFETGLLEWPAGPLLFLNARAGVALAPEMEVDKRSDDIAAMLDMLKEVEFADE